MSVYQINRAVRRVTRQLDRFELQCVKHGSPIERVTFINSPKTEFSQVDFKWRKTPKIKTPR